MKKVLRVLIGLVVFGAIVATSFILAGRKMLSPENITNIMNIIVKNENAESIKEYVFENVDNKDIGKYVDEKDLEKAMGEYFSSALQVAGGSADELKSDKVEDLLKNAAKKYAEETGGTYNEEEIDKAIKDMNDQLNKELKSEDTAAFKPIGYLYSAKPLIISIIVIVVGLGLIYLTSRSLETLLFHAGLTTLINGILLKLGVNGISKLLQSEVEGKMTEDLIKGILGSMNSIAIAGMIIGAVLLGIAIVLHIRKSSEPSESSSPVPESTTTYDYDTNQSEKSVEEVSLTELPEDETPEEENKDL